MGRMDRTMQMLALMQEYGWSYDEYMSTPSWILTVMIEKMRIDRKREELAAKRAHRGH
jgi:hypothetical protein